MPTPRSSASGPAVAPLIPLLRYYLLTGDIPKQRVENWVAFFRLADREVADAWTQHGPSLVAEAQRHDFEPWWQSQRVPRGPGFARWRERFLAAHAY